MKIASAKGGGRGEILDGIEEFDAPSALGVYLACEISCAEFKFNLKVP